LTLTTIEEIEEINATQVSVVDGILRKVVFQENLQGVISSTVKKAQNTK